MSVHREHEEALLDALAQGESMDSLGETPPYSDCPSCREYLGELQAAEALVLRVGEAERAELQSLSEQAEEMTPGRAERHLRELVSNDQGTRAPRPWKTRRRGSRWGAMLVAATLVAAVGFLMSRDHSSTPEDDGIPDVSLGGSSSETPSDRFTQLAPSGMVSAYESFHWQYDGERGAQFVVRVYDAAGSRDVLVAESSMLSESGWNPDASVLASLPDKIRWVVEAYHTTKSDRRWWKTATAERRP